MANVRRHAAYHEPPTDPKSSAIPDTMPNPPPSSFSSPSPDLHSAQTRALQFADKLFAALEDLQAAGGLDAFARQDPKAADKVAEALISCRKMTDDELAWYRAVRPGKGRRK